MKAPTDYRIAYRVEPTNRPLVRWLSPCSSGCPLTLRARTDGPLLGPSLFKRGGCR